jgi:hypothetical protein
MCAEKEVAAGREVRENEFVKLEEIAAEASKLSEEEWASLASQLLHGFGNTGLRGGR